MRKAKDIVHSLTADEAKTYLIGVLEALYCHDADGDIDLDKQWSPDELDSLAFLLDPLLPVADEEDKLDPLIDEYAEWNKEEGLNLGSADEHLDDLNLTPAQREWLRDFSKRWDAVAYGESEVNSI
jgi:hypothetical protein